MQRQIMTPAECRQQVEKCRSWAKTAITLEAKNAFHGAADAWAMLANRYEANDRLSRAKRPAYRVDGKIADHNNRT